MEKFTKTKNFIKTTFILKDIFKILVIILKKIKIISRVKDIFFMYICLNFYPSITYKFSTRRLLPPPEKRFKSYVENFPPVKIISKEENTMKYFDEVNLVGYGKSFDINNIKNFKKPTFLISFWSTLRQRKNGSLVIQYTKEDFRFDSNNETLKPYNNDNLYYIVARQDVCDDLIKNNCNIINVEAQREIISGDYIIAHNYNHPYNGSTQQKEIAKFKNYKKKKMILNISENFYKPVNNYRDAIDYFAPAGSFLTILSSLIPFCNKINIYGWDFYLNKNANSLNAIEIQKTFFNPKLDWDGIRSWFHFESTLINYYYAYILSKEKILKYIAI